MTDKDTSSPLTRSFKKIYPALAKRNPVILESIQDWRDGQTAPQELETKLCFCSTDPSQDKLTLVLPFLLAAAGAEVPVILPPKFAASETLLGRFGRLAGMDLWISAPGFLSLLKKTKTAIAYPPETLTVLFEPHNKKSRQSQYLQNTGASLLLSPPHGAVFHVKIGAGSWVKTDQAGTALVERLKSLCQSIGINHSVLFSNDFQPLGQALGGVPAMREALDILQGTGPLDFLKLTLELGADALRLILPRSQKTEVKIFLKNLILSGKAADKLPEVIQKQGGNPKIVDTLCSRSEQMVRIVCTAPRGGFIQKISWARTRALQKKIETVDTDAGIVFQKKTGDPVKRGEILGEICLSKAQKKRGFKEAFKKIFLFSETPPPFQPLIKGRI